MHYYLKVCMIYILVDYMYMEEYYQESNSRIEFGPSIHSCNISPSTNPSLSGQRIS